MVAIVAGNGLGLFNTSLNSLGGSGSPGQGNLGQAGGQALVNISNGNLVLRFTDEQLSGLGQDLLHTRTYNTRGDFSDADADGWRWDAERSLTLVGTLNTAGSQMVRITGDGHKAVYRWDGTRYQSTEGDGAHDTLTWDDLAGQVVWTDGSRRTTERYNWNGQLVSTTDANGTQISYSYDVQGRLSSVKDSSGQELVLNYNATGKLERLDTRRSAGEALTRQVYYTYDGLGRLTSVSTDLSPQDNSIADGKVYTTSYTYVESSFYIASVTQSDGTTVNFGYEQVGVDYRVSIVSDASGITRFSYDTANRRTDVLNGLGQQWSYYYDTQDQLIEVRTPAVNGQRLSTRYSYDADGNVLQVVDGRGNSVSYGYDTNGNRVLERDSAGNTITSSYNADNQLLNEVRYRVPATRNGTGWTEPPASSAQVTRYAYDSNNRLRFTVDGAGQVVEYRYNANGLRTQEVSYGDAQFAVSGLAPADVLSESSLITWAAARDKTRSTLTELSYDYRGNLNRRVVYAAVAANGAGLLGSATNVTEFIYSEHGQLLQTLAVRGADRSAKAVLTSIVYDGMGRVLSQTDASGTRTTVYNGLNRTVTTTNSAGLTISQSYDTWGRLITQSETAANATPRSTLYVYDAAGRQTMVQDATGVRSYVLYDEAGRISAQINGLGAVTEFVYNASGQRIQEKRYATLIDTTGGYDGTTVFVTQVTQVRPPANADDRVTSFTYDSAGRLSTTTTPAGLVTTLSYDGLGQLVRQQGGDRITRFFYDASGHQTGQLDAEGYLRENRYDATGRLVQTLRYAAVTAAANRESGTLDQLRPSEGGSLSTWYFYDAAGRQVGSLDEQQFVTETVFDEATNTQQTVRYAAAYTAAVNSNTGFATLKAAVSGSARQTSTTAFDGQGRVAQRTATDGTVTAYEYDAAGRLVRETRAQGTPEARSVLTRYDAFGQTIGKLLGEASGRITVGMTDAQVAAVYAQYGLTYRYDAAGRVASASDALGNRTLSYYDAAGRLTHVINALGEVSETRYTAFGDASERATLTNRLSTANTATLSGGLLTVQVNALVQAIRDANTDNRSFYAYTTSGTLAGSSDALGNTVGYAYNLFGEQVGSLRTSTSGTTIRESLAYNRRGELIGKEEDVGGLSRTSGVSYDAFGRVINRIDGRGQINSTSYLDNGRVIVESNPLSQTQGREYDAFGRVLRQMDARGLFTTYSYNDSTRTLVVTTPDGLAMTTVRNRHGETLTITDSKGRTQAFSYDKNGQQIASTDGLARTTTNTYDVAGHLLSVTDAVGRVTTYGYDAANRMISRTDAAGVVTQYAFDGQGRKVRMTEAGQRITDYAYDRKGQLLTVVQDPNGLKLTTTYTYDGFGRQVQMARGTTANPNQQIVLYVFDSLGRRTAERLDPNGYNLTTQYFYNANDQVTRKLDPGGNSTWYVYDNAGRVTDTVDALGGVTRSTYDPDGRLASTTRFATALSASALAALGNAPANVAAGASAKDQITTYLYDQMGRVKVTIDALNQVTETLYDQQGRITESRLYDKAMPAGTPRTFEGVTAALTNLGALTYTTRSVYDAAGQLSSVTDAAGKTESYTYDAVGNRVTLTNKNGSVWNYRYDNVNRLVEEITPAVAVSSIDINGVVSTRSVLQVTRITYDALSNVTSRTAGRLRSALAADPAGDDLSQARTTAYAYDAVGHQVQITAPGWYNKVTGAYQQASDGTANTLQVTTDVTYDALGNALRNRVRVNNTGAPGTDFVDSYKAYDTLGRLTHDIDPLKGVTAYTYDAQGNRLTTKRYANALTAPAPTAGYYTASDLNSSTLIPNASQDRTLITTYDALGRKTAVQQDAVSVYTFTGNVATSTLITASPTTVYSYNALGQLVRETLIARNASGVTVQNGASNVYYYDLAGQRIGSVDGQGNYTRMEYNVLGKVSRQVEYANVLSGWDDSTPPSPPVISVNDRSTRFEYDAMGRLSQVTQEGVRYWQQTINGQSGTVSAVAVVGNQLVSQMYYDGVGNVRAVVDAAGNVTSTEYNALGQTVRLVEPARATAKNGAVDPFAGGFVFAAPTTTYALNAFGQVLSETESAGVDSAGNQQAGVTRVTRSRFDAAGYEVQSIDASGSAQSYKVDAAGRRLEESRQINVTLSGWTVGGAVLTRTQTIRRGYTYDVMGQQLSTTDWYTAADNTQKTTINSAVYNRFGEVTSQLLNGYLQAGYVYDQAGRVTQQQNAQGVTRVDYDLNAKASRSNQIGDASTAADDRITYTRYDVLGRALEQHLPAFEANINADTLNNINLTLATPIIRQSYDRWGNLLTRTDARGYITTYTYDHNNKQLTETLPVTDILRENGTSYRASLIHEKRYDVLGQLIQEVDLVGPYAGMPTSTALRTRQHVYNQAGELLRDIDALGYSRNYLMDSHGNRVATQDALGTVLVDSYDAMDRQLTHGIVRNGVAVTLSTNQYDQAGRLVGEISGSSAVEETLASASGSGVMTGVAGNVRYTLFDERGNAVKTRNESKVERGYEYSETNRKTKEIDGLNNSLTWDYNEGDFGRVTSHKNLSNYTLNYTYNNFGQILQELATGLYVIPSSVLSGASPGIFRIYANNARNYSYYQNGLLKSVEDTDFKPGATRYKIDIALHEYDLAGNKVREKNSQSMKSGSLLVFVPESSMETRYLLDERSRLEEVKSPAGTTNAIGIDAKNPPRTAMLESLKYDFDEFGNRRRSFMSATNQAGVRTLIDHWYKFDLTDNLLINEGYLNNGQIVVGKAAGIAKGSSLSYDAAGRRLASEQWSSTSGNSEIFKYSGYDYNDLGQVVSIDSRQITRQLGADIAQSVISHGASALDTENIYDLRGNQVQQKTFLVGQADSLTAYAYRGDGQTVLQLSYKIVSGVQKNAQATYLGETGMIDAAGNQLNYRYAVYNSDGVTVAYTGSYAKLYQGFEVYKEYLVTTKWSYGGTDGMTQLGLSSYGNVEQIFMYPGQGYRSLQTNRDGQILTRYESLSKSTQTYFYYNGKVLANAGTASAAEISDSFTTISNDYPGRVPTSYIVNQGDTLASIAQAVWGDAGMWYLIADANGLDPAKGLLPGDTIRIPNVVGSNHNNDTTFKPYSADDVIGDTTPHAKLPPPPPPPKPKKKKSKGIAAVVMVVVAVVATVLTAGAAAPLAVGATATTGGLVATGAAVMTGTIAGAGWGTLGVAMLAGAVGGAASQLAGRAMGVVDSFSWKQVAVGGLTAGLTSGFGTLAQTGALGSWAGTAAEAMKSGGTYGTGYAALGTFNYANSQIASRVVGLDNSFSWRNVAASAVGATVAGYVGGNGPSLVSSTVRGQISAYASAVLKDKWFGGGRPDYGQVAADAFGNTLADYTVRSIVGSDATQGGNSQAEDVKADAARRMTAQGYTPAQIRNLLQSGYLPPVEIEAIGSTDDGRTGYFYDSGAISISAPAEQGFLIGAPIESSAASVNSELSLYERMRSWASDGRQYDRAYYSDIVNTAEGTSGAVLGSVGRALNAAGWDIAESVTGLVGLATDSHVRSQTYAALESGVSYVWNNPGDAVEAVSDAASGYYSSHSAQQIAEDTLTFAAGFIATAGVGKAAAMAGKSGLNFVKNSQIVFSPRGGTFYGGIVVPGVNFTRITTVSRAMSERFQGMGYLDPMTNRITRAPLGAAMEVDHIFPVSKIVDMPGFNTLNKSQMTAIVQDAMGLGNLQPLPKGFNASKGASVKWETYGKDNLHGEYIEGLKNTQREMERLIQNQIRAYQSSNRLGGK